MDPTGQKTDLNVQMALVALQKVPLVLCVLAVLVQSKGSHNAFKNEFVLRRKPQEETLRIF